MSDISPSALGESDAEFEARINKMADFQEIRSAMRQRGIDAGLVRPDNDPYHLIEIAQPTPKTFTEVVEIGGQKGFVEGNSELSAAKAAVEFYRSRLGTQQTQQTQPTQSARDEHGRFQRRADEQQQQLSQAEVEQQATDEFTRAQLQLQFQTGAITADEFLEKTGAIDGYLAKRGITPDVLREVVEERQDAAEVESWQRAVEAFRNSVEGSDWPGGNRNRDILVEVLETSGLVAEPDKSGALKAAYLYTKEHGLLVENDEISYAQALEECKSQKEIDAVNASYRESLGLQTNQGSTFWGSR